jgi:glutamine---fructose-6-phosphate transaminase (isomerizing)
MCGLIACQSVAPATEHLIPALRRLEYRGYDSAGVAVRAAHGETVRLRAVGRMDTLARLVQNWQGPALGHQGIGHTRWATHGAVSERNAHPHFGCTGRISLVHNGIIENANFLRNELQALGHRFAASVDSEVLCHLIEVHLAECGDVFDAVRIALTEVVGSWGLAVMDQQTGRIVVAALGSPLLVARTPIGDFATSDIVAVEEWVDDYAVLEDGDVVELSRVEEPLAATPQCGRD